MHKMMPGSNRCFALTEHNMWCFKLACKHHIFVHIDTPAWAACPFNTKKSKKEKMRKL